MFCGTWNVNDQNALRNLRNWLAVDLEPPDLYAVGFQELDMSTEALLFTNSAREEEWLKAVTKSLHPKAKYQKAHLIRLVGIMLIVFYDKRHAPFIKDISANYQETGMLNTGIGKIKTGLGNKGGVAIRLKFYNTSICFVCSHFAAHVKEVDQRNQDFNDIYENISFDKRVVTNIEFYPSKKISGHDMIFWMGDLNYRFDNLDASEVKDCIREGRIEELKKNDQLIQQRSQNKVFQGFEEGHIDFLPTYKFDPGTDDWDSSEKNRAPAWTDRVLWKGKNIDLLHNRSHKALKISDHKPVSALFRTGIKLNACEKKALDSCLPEVEVDITKIHFNKIMFLEAQTQTFSITNIGKVPVEFEVMKPQWEESNCQPWLTVFPSDGFIKIDDKVDVTIKIMVDENTIGPLTCRSGKVEDKLMVQIIHGQNFDINISGEYQPSCFGTPINALVRMTVPIREIANSAILNLEEPDLTNSVKDTYPVPKELWFLCDLIISLGLGHENLFSRPDLGHHSEIILLRNWLDTGLPVTRPDVSIHSAAETLLIFLKSLQGFEIDIPQSQYNQSLSYLDCRDIVSKWSYHCQMVFNYVCAFLREVLRYSALNKTNVATLTQLFGPILLQWKPGSQSDKFDQAKFLQQFLTL